MNTRRLLALTGALLTLGCTDLTSPDRLAGTWQEAQTIPGSSVEFTLGASGNAITGSGTWTGEACCSGTLVVSGDESDGVVHLDFTFTSDRETVPLFTSHFDGRLADESTLSGTVTGSSQVGSAITYKRVQ